MTDRPRNRIEIALGIPAMKPGETLIDGDLVVYCGTYEGIRFVESPVIETIPATQDDHQEHPEGLPE
jgi:hypothetical protein